MSKVQRAAIIILIALLALSACNFPRSATAISTPVANEQDAVRTAAALTVEAMGTELASSPTPAPPTLTPAATQTAQPNAPTLTPVAFQTNTPLPLLPTSTATGICDRAKFTDETVKDGSTFAPGTAFTKTWTFSNDGTCTWDSSYSLVFLGGDAMNGVASKPLTTGTIGPGQTLQVSVDLTAPSNTGTFRGNWGLRNGAGIIFSKFWVEIVVPSTTYSFIDNMCKAEWRSGSGVLSCPGNTTDTSGFVVKVNNPVLDGGYQDNEPALETAPQAVNNGTISGKYPAISVTTGSHFKTVIGCLSGSTNCSVTFTLAYIANGGSQTTFKTWTKTNDGKFIKVDEDLSSLAGQSTQFILMVTANGTGVGTKSYWLLPRIQ